MLDSTVLAGIRARFRLLERSEKRAVALLVSFFAVVLAYYLVWSPLMNWRASAEEFRDSSYQTLQMMRDTESVARIRGSGGQARSDEPLLTLISTAAREQGLNPNRLQPEGEDTVSLWFDEVPFAEVMRLLEKAAQIPGLQIQQLVIDRSDKPGTVRARVVISRS